jgi:hypothetical protein
MKLAALAALALFLATMLQATAAAECTNGQSTPPDADCAACTLNNEADKDGDCICDSADAFPEDACEHEVAIDENGKEIRDPRTGKLLGANDPNVPNVLALQKRKLESLKVFQSMMQDAQRKKDALDCSAETYATEAEAQACDPKGAAHAMGDAFMPGATHTFQIPFRQFDPETHCDLPQAGQIDVNFAEFDIDLLKRTQQRLRREQSLGYGYGIAEMLEWCACPSNIMVGFGSSDTMMPMMPGFILVGDSNQYRGPPSICEANNCDTFPAFNPSDTQHCAQLLQVAEFCDWPDEASSAIQCSNLDDLIQPVLFDDLIQPVLSARRTRRLAASVGKFPAFMMQMHDAYGRGTGYFEYNHATARFTSRTIPDGELYYQLDAGTAGNFLNGISSKPIFVTRGGPDATSPTVKGRFHMPLPGDVNNYRITKTDSDLPLSTNEVMFSMAVDHTYHVEHCRSMVSNGPPKGEIDGAEPLAERLRHFTHCTSVVEAETK